MKITSAVVFACMYDVSLMCDKSSFMSYCLEDKLKGTNICFMILSKKIL